MRITGSGGRVRVGAQWAATLGTWHLTRSGNRVTIDASISDCDEYWIQQRPWRVSIRIASRTWVWTGQAGTLNGESLTVICQGEPEVH